MKKRISSATKVWLAVFGLWSLLLSGALASFVGSPGVIQALRLRSLLSTKNQQFAGLEAEIQNLDSERDRLEKNRLAQEREIRKTLGYAAEDEIIFDFSASSRIRPRRQ